LIKCAVSQIPIVMSRSAPTSLAVTLARKLGITLIGFVRGNKFNVYSNAHRVRGE
jgi:FdhD protein